MSEIHNLKDRNEISRVVFTRSGRLVLLPAVGSERRAMRRQEGCARSLPLRPRRPWGAPRMHRCVSSRSRSVGLPVGRKYNQIDHSRDGAAKASPFALRLLSIGVEYGIEYATGFSNMQGFGILLDFSVAAFVHPGTIFDGGRNDVLGDEIVRADVPCVVQCVVL
jgi:hypothetical protein